MLLLLGTLVFACDNCPMFELPQLFFKQATVLLLDPESLASKPANDIKIPGSQHADRWSPEMQVLETAFGLSLKLILAWRQTFQAQQQHTGSDAVLLLLLLLLLISLAD